LPTTVIRLVEHWADRLEAAGLSLADGFGQGTLTAFDEAAWLVLWSLGLPLDELDEEEDTPVTAADAARVADLLQARISTRKPAAYLTREAWLQGVPFYVDERVIIPRSLIAELLVDESIDPWLSEPSAAPGRPKQANAPSGGSAAHEVASVGAPVFRVLDLCTGNGSLAILAAMAYPDVVVDAADISADALAVARINVDVHELQQRITLIASDGLAACPGPYDLILCNPPYVNAATMAALPAEFRAEPALALAGGEDGMDFIRSLFLNAAAHMSENAVLVLEIGNERANFERAFPGLEPLWFETSAGPDQVLLLTRQQLA
jgi:ribosomal protein L3 glutamine methyltransferase